MSTLLNNYIKDKGISNADFVKRLRSYGIRTTEAQVHQLRYGREPGKKMALAIFKAVNKEISLFDILYPKNKAV